MGAPGKAKDRNIILVVDDDEDIREVVRATLQDMAGYRVVVAASGHEAVDVARQENPDLVLLDAVMPVLSGLATLQRLRDDPTLASLPVVFMTANVGARDRARYTASGAVGVVVKPFDPLSLLEQVAALLSAIDGPPSP
ncbi:MAG: response regulator [Myxococcales bacterium]|nr:response regulator [Myxococcales bacterium]